MGLSSPSDPPLPAAAVREQHILPGEADGGPGAGSGTIGSQLTLRYPQARLPAGCRDAEAWPELLQKPFPGIA